MDDGPDWDRLTLAELLDLVAVDVVADSRADGWEDAEILAEAGPAAGKLAGRMANNPWSEETFVIEFTRAVERALAPPPSA
jgi:hypothetical protein